jgi:hypothetical protein
LGFFAYHFYQLFGSEKRWQNYAMVIVMSCVLIVLKLYVFMAFFPAIVIWLIITKWKRSFWVYFFMYLGFISIATLLGELNPRYDFVNLIVDKQKQFIRLADFYEVNSGFEMAVLSYDFWSVLIATPEAIFNVFTKPWPNELNSILYLPAFVENAVIIFLLLFCMVYRKTLSSREWDFVIFCISFCVILFAVIGLTTPITGAIVRYKIPAMPFLFMAVFMFMNPNQLPKICTENKLSRWINTFL